MTVDLAMREQLSNLRGLLALSMVMTERREAEEIVPLVVTAVPALVRATPVGILLSDGSTERWTATAGPLAAASVRADVQARLRALSVNDGPLTLRDTGWTWAFSLRSLGEWLGHLVVVADSEPAPADLLLLRSLAQQAGTALANARLHARNRTANEELARTVEVLRSKTAIHDRFTQVALLGSGQQGIVDALHQLTGLAACVEDRAGVVRAWAGPEGSEPPTPMSTRRREQVLQRALRAGHPIRIDGRLLTVARPRADVVGVLSLIDPDGCATEPGTVALEHAATVLAIELARLHSLAETELRLGRDLVADLVGGVGDDAERRARALGHDLGRPHRVVVLAAARGRTPVDELLLKVRQALSGGSDGPPALLMPSGSTVVTVVPEGHGGAEDRVIAMQRSLGSGVRMGVGGRCASAQDVPRSYREARLALRVAGAAGLGDTVVRYDDLGVYQLLSEVAEPSSLDAFARRWLGPPLAYDDRRGTDLVPTLARFLESGGSYDATAAALSLGRTTVRYRLRRIQELTGHDLGDPGIRFQLQLATKAWTIRSALAPTGPG